MKGDIDRSTLTNRLVPIAQSQIYTLLSRAKSRDKVKILYFKPSYIKSNEEVLKEMSRIRAKAMFSLKHPAEMLWSILKLSLLNIRSWNGHISHFLAQTMYSTAFSLMSFTATTSNEENFRDIDSYENNLKSLHKFTSHGYQSICYQTLKILLYRRISYYITHWDTTSFIQSRWYKYVIVLIYQPPSKIRTFIADLIEALHLLPSHHPTVVLGNFNIDQRSQGDVNLLAPLLQEFDFIQQLKFTKHEHVRNTRPSIWHWSIW